MKRSHSSSLVLLLLLQAGCATRAMGDPQGAQPAGPIVAENGAIFGTTEYGGPNCQTRATYQQTKGCGVIYRIAADGAYAVLHAFAGPDGDRPASGLASGPDGTLYGSTDGGGANGHGVVYKISPDGSGFAVLYSFSNGDRHGTLTIAPDGTAYGVAPPAHGDGHGASVFALKPDGRFETLWVFGRESHVATPLAIDSVGRLFEIVVRGGQCGGDVFWVTASGAYGILVSNNRPYTSRPCSVVPTSPLFDEAGTLYATGGRSLFRVDADRLTALYTLPQHSRRKGPFARLLGTFVDGSLAALPDGSLVGIVAADYPTDCGKVFRYDPSDGFTVLATLPAGPRCELSLDPLGPPGGVVAVGDQIYFTTGDGAHCTAAHSPPVPICGALLALGAARETRPAFVFDPIDPPTSDSEKYAHGAWVVFGGAVQDDALSISFSAAPASQAPYYVRTGTASLSLHPFGDASKTIPLRFRHEIDRFEEASPDGRYAGGSIVVESPRLPSGLYSVDWTRFEPTVTDADAFPLDLSGMPKTWVYLPPAPSHTPDMRVGQEFVEFKQSSGGFSGPRPTTLRVLTLIAVRPSASGSTLDLKAQDGSRLSVETAGTDVTAIPGLTPIVDDERVRALDARYTGRDVYPIGDFAPSCIFASGGETIPATDQATALHVRRIVRLYGVNASWGIGPMIDRTLDAGDVYVYSDPLLVIYGGRIEDGVLAEPPFNGHECSAAYDEIADTWDFERDLSPTDLLAGHPGWSAAIRDEIRQHTVSIGMTRQQVVASVGYPSVYGSVDAMMKLDEWDYILPTPSSYSIKFKDDRVVEYHPPQMLP